MTSLDFCFANSCAGGNCKSTATAWNECVSKGPAEYQFVSLKVEWPHVHRLERCRAR